MSRYPDLGAAFGAIHENLAELDTRQTRLLECRLAHLDEWADMAVRVSGGERDNLFRLLDAVHPERDIPPDGDIPSENIDFLQTCTRHLAPPERIAILRAVIARCGIGILLYPEDTPSDGDDLHEISEHAAGKIAYVQNTFSDTAYLHFSTVVDRPRAAYFDSFSDVCEEVYNGICEYCILPILHQRDGKLFRFYDLLEKYDLRIICACDVPQTDKNGVTVTRYALIRKTLPSLSAWDDSMPTHLEFCLPADDSVTLCELFEVAQICRLTPSRVDTRAVEAEYPEQLMHRITFRLHDADIATFLAYLSLHIPRGILLGLYHVQAPSHM